MYFQKDGNTMNDKATVEDFTYEELCQINKNFLMAYAMMGLSLLSEQATEVFLGEQSDYLDGYMDAYEHIGQVLFASYGIDVSNMNGG